MQIPQALELSIPPSPAASALRFPSVSSLEKVFTGMKNPLTASRTFGVKMSPKKTFPQWVETPTYEAIPEYLVEPVKEAHETQAMGFYRSSVILARAVIEATAKDRGADGRDLYQRIKKLREMELITPLTESGAHIVRDSGNNMAHGDFEEEVDWELAEATLEFMGFVLADVYVAPARVKAMEARIEASKAAQRNAKLEESSS